MEDSFKQTDIGLIPEDWDVDELINHINKPQYGFTESAVEKGNVQFLRITDITDFGVDWSKVPYCNCPDEKIGTYRLKKNDIVFARIGATTGKSYLIKNPPNSIFASYLIRVQSYEDLDAPYLYYFFNSSEYWKQIISNKGRNLKGGVSASILSKLKIPLPPLPEQKKITHVLSKIQGAIETQEQIIKTTQELKKALMQKLFTEGLPASGGTEPEPQKQTEIGSIPESWDVVKLGGYAKILNGYAFKSEDYIKKGIPLIRISNVSFGYLISKDDKYLPTSYLDEYSDYALNEGDLILSLTRPVTSGGMKYCFIEKRHLPALLNQRVGRFNIIDDGLSKDFLYHIVFSKYFIGELQKLFGSSSQQPNVSPSQLESFKIPLPNPEEQIEISNSLDAINYKIQYSKQSISFLKSLFISTLNKLMTGQIRVNDIEFKLDKLEYN